MKKISAVIFYFLLCVNVFSQKSAINTLLSDSTMQNGSVSVYIIRADNQEVLIDYNSEISLIPGSVVKLFTTSAALELLGPDHSFKTSIGYTGKLDKKSGVLHSDIIITGGGDPALGSKRFEEHYKDFVARWTNEIKNTGIKKIKGRVITDDSYFDYQPTPAKWVWEDIGNYYGAGAFGFSVFDNTSEIHLKTFTDSTVPEITGIYPEEYNIEYTNLFIPRGTEDDGYVFAAPYNTTGWFSGVIPSNTNDYVIKASITDPPLLMAKTINKKLKQEGITITGEPSTTRILNTVINEPVHLISETSSPPLSKIIEVLNQESINLYAEHLVKELGKTYESTGSTEAGLKVVCEFINSKGLGNPGIHIEDGSGLSPLNSLNARSLTDLLYYMRNKSKYFDAFYRSLPEAGKTGTLKNYFKDPVFENRIKAKSGSMTRVRSYSGYLKAESGDEFIFSILINNYSGTSKYNISLIENLLKQVIINN